MSKFLVTGGAGFIGSHIVEKLVKDGHSVRVFDNLSSGKLENLAFTGIDSQVLSPQGTVPNFDFVKGDIRDYLACLTACEGIDYVLHQAALRSVPKSMEDPYSYNEVNINGTLNMLKAAKEKAVKRFVFASSSSIYGDVTIFPQKEEHLPRLISPYALSKLAGEYYCRIFSENFGLETVSLRYFNVFGPRQSLDDEYAVVIPKFISCILNDEQPPIFGDGKQSRDFTYVDNIVKANIHAATVGLQGLSPKGTAPKNTSTVAHEVINIANGKDNSVLELVATLNKLINKDIQPQFKPIRAGDVFRTLADISKAKEKLGYQTKVSFEEGLKKTVEYFKAHELAKS
ncbi:SDR family oxidoreductase [Candidatus Omnitrophota bacterium]